ncbi:MAG: CCA tRNA nucleotidyltransferase [Lentisphaeria bacterium]|nr:CCA tRNA nucleotidyltransferase [Lentisphaeria bacterium]
MFGDPLKRETLSAVRSLAARFRERGYALCVVGGAVRDMVSGRTPADVDLVTSATPDEIFALFPESKLTGACFGVVRLRAEGREFEVASARLERGSMDGRHPEKVRYTRDLDTDALRRDFTVNAMRWDPLSEELSDPAGGQKDLACGLIRTVGDPGIRFEEDYLRMLRAVRFASTLGFEIEPAAFAAIRALAPRCAELSGERIREELTRMLTGRFPDRALTLLEETGLLQAVLPEAAAMKGVRQPEEFHPEGDVFEHTRLMLRRMVCPDELLAWSVLLHDVGKPGTASVDPDGRIRFFGHEELGEKIVHAVAERLHFSTAARDAIGHAVRNHMRMASVRDMREPKLKRLLAEEHFGMELELHRLDCLSSHGFMETFLFLLDALSERPDRALPDPWVRGRDLLAEGFRPSPAFGKVLSSVFDRQLAGGFADRAAALDFACRALREAADVSEKCSVNTQL